jgi:hypothetical protein
LKEDRSSELRPGAAGAPDLSIRDFLDRDVLLEAPKIASASARG